MPTSSVKPKSFTFTLSRKEIRMLREIAEAEDRSASQCLRRMIQEKHEGLERRFAGLEEFGKT